MREHMGLFRGKRIDNGEWVDGAFCPRNLGGNNPCIIKLTGAFAGYWFEVDPYTIGECTGLKDKNGNLIFEGDILEGYDFDADSGYGVVELYDGAFEVANDYWVGTFHENYRSFLFEIIGNVHDNPELLERG